MKCTLLVLLSKMWLLAAIGAFILLLVLGFKLYVLAAGKMMSDLYPEDKIIYVSREKDSPSKK